MTGDKDTTGQEWFAEFGEALGKSAQQWQDGWSNWLSALSQPGAGADARFGRLLGQCGQGSCEGENEDGAKVTCVHQGDLWTAELPSTPHRQLARQTARNLPFFGSRSALEGARRAPADEC